MEIFKILDEELEKIERQVKRLEQEKEECSIHHPNYYRAGGLEVIEVIEAWNLNFHLGNVVKYVLRAGKKDKNKKKEDLEKARNYLSREIERLDNYEKI